METSIQKLQELLRQAYFKLTECDDDHADGDSWKSEYLLGLMNEIADALDIDEKDRY